MFLSKQTSLSHQILSHTNPQHYKLTTSLLWNGMNIHTFTHQLRPLYTNHWMDEITNSVEGTTFVPITTEDKKQVYQQ